MGLDPIGLHCWQSREGLTEGGAVYLAFTVLREYTLFSL